MSKRLPISRRGLLKGVGGLTVGLPWLEMTAGRAAAQPVGGPQRFVLFFHPQGTLLDEWVPSSTGSNYSLPPFLQALQPHRSKMLLVSGVDNVAAREMTRSNGHNRAARSILTNTLFTGALDANGNVQSSQPENGPAAGPSVDQVVAQRWAGRAPWDRYDLMVGRRPSEYQIFWANRDVPISSTWDPRSAFDQLFQPLLDAQEEPPPEPSPMERLRAQRRSVLDAVLDNYNGLMARAPAQDRQRLEQYMQSLREIERRTEAIPVQQPDQCVPPSFTFPNGYMPSEERFDEYTAPAQVDNLSMALACDLTRVATLQFANDHAPRFPWTGANIPGRWSNWHDMVHTARDQQDGRDALRTGFSFYASMFRRLLDNLDAIPEGNGSVLDHTLVLWISEFGHGGRHDTRDLPVVLAGNAQGRLAVGQHLDRSGHTLGELYTGILQMLGFEDTRFGLEYGAGGTPLQNGPIPGLTV